MNFGNLIQRGAVERRPLRVLIHSEPKVGKSHLVAGAPDVLFLDAEQGSLSFEVARAPISEWRDLQEAMRFLEAADHGFKTVVLDTIDSLERLLMMHICQCDGKDTIEDVGGGFSKGWVKLEEEWHWITDRLANIQQRRAINVVALAHCEASNHSEPTGESWKTWRLRANKRTTALWTGWVEEILFLRRLVSTRKGIAAGSQLALETRSSPAWQAGSRRLRARQVKLPNADPPQVWAVLRNAYLASMTMEAPAGPAADGGRETGTDSGAGHGDHGAPDAGAGEHPDASTSNGEFDPPRDRGNCETPFNDAEPDPDKAAEHDRRKQHFAERRKIRLDELAEHLEADRATDGGRTAMRDWLLVALPDERAEKLETWDYSGMISRITHGDLTAIKVSIVLDELMRHLDCRVGSKVMRDWIHQALPDSHDRIPDDERLVDKLGTRAVDAIRSALAAEVDLPLEGSVR